MQQPTESEPQYDKNPFGGVSPSGVIGESYRSELGASQPVPSPFKNRQKLIEDPVPCYCLPSI